MALEITNLGKQGKSPAFGSVVMKIQNKWEIEFIKKNNQQTLL